MSDGVQQVPCAKVMAHLWDLLDQELTPDTMRAYRAHIERCPACHPHAEFAEQFLAALGRCKCSDPMPDSCREKVMERLREAGLLN